ncbi:MAG: DUF2179 domain-containing protein [Romboutsia sp.]|uniref:DUF2179 domain-containing protein n=1 Tax=Romboutsia sp. TaxID=1965302 RepID=UPI003F3D57FA
MLFKALAIFVLQLIYVPLLTLRTTLVVKGERNKASVTALLEGIIYIFSLGIVFSDLTNITSIVAYVLGYALGVYLGGIIESKLAIGYRTIHISLVKKNQYLVNKLRESKFGVTTFIGHGINGDERYRLEILAHRIRECEVIEIVQSEEPSAFIVSYDLTQFKGGYLSKQMK